MTNKLSDSTLPDMELNLESFLQLCTDEDYEEVPPFSHRTIDDILNDSDSDSCQPSLFVHHQDHFSNISLCGSQPRRNNRNGNHNNDDASVSTPKVLSDSVFKGSSKLSSVDLKNSSITRFDNTCLPGRKSTKLLPELLGNVRSKAKPGAALAAAVAASRSLRTPHAIAIKTRRLESVLDSKETEVASEASNVAELESRRLADNSREEVDKMGDFQSASSNKSLERVDVSGEFSGTSNPERVDEAHYESGTAAKALESGHELEVCKNNNSADIAWISSVVPDVTLSVDDNKNLNLDDEPQSSGFEDTENQERTSLEDVVVSSADVSAENTKVEDEASGLLISEDQEKSEFLSEDRKMDIGSIEASSATDVTELVEDMLVQLESQRLSKEGKKLHYAAKPLELAEELEKKHASTGLHWEEGVASQPMRLEGVRRGSISLGYFDIDANNAVTRAISSQTFNRDHGSSQSLAVHLNYIAVGMSKGSIAVVPSKYSAHNVDNMDSKMLMLGYQCDKSPVPVTSMCFNQQGELLLAGYGNGHLVVWDVQRAEIAKVITGKHTTPVVHTLFLGQDSQNTRQFNAISGDSKGLVLLHALSLSVVPLLNMFSIKTQCIIDGQRTSTVLSVSPLIFDEPGGGALMSSMENATTSTSSLGSVMGGVVGGETGWKLFNEGSNMVGGGVVIFVTYQTALVVRLSPTLKVYAQLTKPDGVREGSMPYTAWRSVAQSPENMPTESIEKVSLLAIAWDRKVQVAQLVKSELKIYGKWILESAAIGVAWLDDQMLVVFTVLGQLCLFAKDGTLIHQTNYSVDGSRVDDLVAYHTHLINIYGNPEKAYHNSMAVRGATIYILGHLHLVICRLLPWKERIQVLRKAGDWMGALNMAMTLYDGNTHGVIDLPRSVNDAREALMPCMVELLMSYVDEVFSYISVAFCNQIGKLEHVDQHQRGSSMCSEIKEQFTRVGGVAVEFCVHIERTDILFDDIFSKFLAVQQIDTFLELLEPYILKDMLGCLPPEIMQSLVEHYSSKGWLRRVEQCVLHMDISSLDFNQVVKLCREHRLYGALVYLFNRGLDDYRAPLEELLSILQNSQKENVAAIGYRMLVYLKYCFLGLAFPPGQGTIPRTRLPSLRTELVQYLLENSIGLQSEACTTSSRTGAYPNLYYLLELDTEATLDVLSCAFVEDDFSELDLPSHDSADANPSSIQEIDLIAESKSLMVQNTVNALMHVIDMNISCIDRAAKGDDSMSQGVWPSFKDIGYLVEFIGYYIACGRANVSGSALKQILECMISESNFSRYDSNQNVRTSKRREKEVLAILERVPETDWDTSYVLQLCEKAGFYQVCGLIYSMRCNYLSALDSYMKDTDEPVHAFSFIHSILSHLSDIESTAFRSAITSRFPDLVNLSREGTFLLVVDHFSKESLHILSEMRSHPKSLFLYLKTVIEVHLGGHLDFSCLQSDTLEIFHGRRVGDQSSRLKIYLQNFSDFPKLLRNNPISLTDEMIELYFKLLCQYESSSVLKFLEIFENYRVEYCLRLCLEHGIIDAAAFLLERVGDAGSALLLTLSRINEKFSALDASVEHMLAEKSLSSYAGIENFITTALKMKEVNDIRDILHACIGLCQRNTPRLDPQESESLWFQLLDMFCEPLTESNNHAVNSQEGEDVCKDKWRISRSRRSARILRRLFSQFIKEIVEGMIGHVRLSDIMSKLLSDNGSQEFGDFKFTILGMLGTYSFERRILDTAKSLIENDTFYNMSLLKKGASHAYSPRSRTCCICNGVITRSSFSSIQVFSCGHGSHLQCEFTGNEASNEGSSGCPICMPKKRGQKPKNKSVLRESNGLVNKPLSKRQGTTISHLHGRSGGLENPYGVQQISRFEMLTNLQKEQRLIQIESVPPLRLAPPAVYHEKIKKGMDFPAEGSGSSFEEVEKPRKNKQFRELRMQGSSITFPWKSSLFGKERASKK